jgi:hypothetical protein
LTRVSVRVLAGVAAVLLAVGVWITAHRASARAPQGVEALVAETVPKVEKAVGLRYKRPPKVEVRSRAQVRAFLEEQLHDPRQVTEIAGTAAVLKLLGMIPDSLDLIKEDEDLLTEQIAGFYDPKTKVLYWIAGESQDMLDQVIPHELVHALQDQYINLDSIENAEGNDDRTLAAQSVFEGQAVYEQLAIAMGNTAFAAHLPGIYDKMREMIRQNRKTMPQFSAAPMVVQETTIFPYLNGLEFMQRYEAHFPGGIPYEHLPVSTQQVLSEQAYFGAPPKVPIVVTLPAPKRGTVRYVNTMGEFQTRLFFYQHLEDLNVAVRGAAAWSGDRYEVIDVPGGQALVWVTLLDSPVDAAQFIDLARQSMPQGRPKRTVTVSPIEVGGHPGVLYVDSPGVPVSALVDTARVTARSGA